MKQLGLVKWMVLGFAGLSSVTLYAGSGVCFHCEEIRENNKKNPHNYEYYEDYLLEQQKTADVATQNPASTTIKNAGIQNQKKNSSETADALGLQGSDG